MTRKHFAALADELAGARPYCDGTDLTIDAARMAQWARTVEAVANACYRFNGRFDRERFMRAAHADRLPDWYAESGLSSLARL